MQMQGKKKKKDEEEEEENTDCFRQIQAQLKEEIGSEDRIMVRNT